jgi:ATP-dependent DNA helicase RecQ
MRTCNETAPELVLAWHWLTTAEDKTSGLNSFFTTLRLQVRPDKASALTAIDKLLHGCACATHGKNIVETTECHGWTLAYALAWLSVSGGNSVMPPWVRHEFPMASDIIRLLRDTACSDQQCDWCSKRHNARYELKHWFGFDDFRPDPPDQDGRPMQQAIVEAAMRREHILGILPTGTGKSLCYQIPALSRYDKTGLINILAPVSYELLFCKPAFWLTQDKTNRHLPMTEFKAQ